MRLDSKRNATSSQVFNLVQVGYLLATQATWLELRIDLAWFGQAQFSSDLSQVFDRPTRPLQSTWPLDKIKSLKYSQMS